MPLLRNQSRHGDRATEIFQDIRPALRALILIAVFTLGACEGSDNRTPAASDYQDALRAALLNAQPGDIIEIPGGIHNIDQSLSLTVDGVTIRGEGMKRSVLSFKGQSTGAGGLVVSANDVTIEDLAIEDTRGNALTVMDGRNIIIRRIRTEWTPGPKTGNGAYGIYLLRTSNVLIEGNVAKGASDAGIFISQSRRVIARGNRAEENVAGIEIANTNNADIYKNTAVNNTGGIVIVNVVGIDERGENTRIFNNRIVNNKTRNFAAPDTLAAAIPAGAGVVINSYDHIEIFENEISNNKTANVILLSAYSSAVGSGEPPDTFDGYPEGIYIHDNQLGGGGTNPDGIDLQAVKTLQFGLTGALPDILWDGIIDRTKLEDGALPTSLRICVDNGTAQLMNLDAANRFKDPKIIPSVHDCRHEPLPSVSLAEPLADI